jgi:hypothetical protein
MVAPAFQGAKKLLQACLAQPVDIIATYANPEHGGQVSDWVALVCVQHELGHGGRARGEIQHQRISRVGVPVGREVRAVIVCSRVGYPAFFLAANDDADVIITKTGKLFCQAKIGNDVSGLAALQAIT